MHACGMRYSEVTALTRLLSPVLALPDLPASLLLPVPSVGLLLVLGELIIAAVS